MLYDSMVNKFKIIIKITRILYNIYLIQMYSNCKNVKNKKST
jgi:hypothetical protein